MADSVGTTWLIAGSIAAFASAVAAFGSVVVATLSLRSHTRAIDVSSYLALLERLQAFERRLARSISDEAEREFTRREYCNFLDGVAHLYNKKRISGGTAVLCQDALANSIAALEISVEVMRMLEGAFTSRETFEHLVQFRARYSNMIEARKAIFCDMTSERSRVT